MLRLKTQLFSVFALAASLGACDAVTIDQRSNTAVVGSKPAEADVSSTPAPTPPPVVTPVPTPLYPFDTALNDRFPLHNGDGSQVAWLARDHEAWAARMQLLNSATISVRIQSFTFNPDEAGYLMTRKLIELANRGVRVRLNIDPVINYGSDARTLFFDLRVNGIEIEGYELLYLNTLQTFINTTLANTYQLANRRFHEKMFVIDAENPAISRALVGSSNVSNEHYRIDTEHPANMWSDREVALRGPIVTDLARLFDENHQELYNIKVQNGLDTLGLVWDFLKSFFVDVDDIYAGLSQTLLNRLHVSAVKVINYQFVDMPMRYIRSRPLHKENFIYPRFIEAIDAATTNVMIGSGYFLPEPEMTAAILRAASRGVKVQILTNHRQNTNVEPIVIAARAHYREMLAFNQAYPTGPGKVEIYEWLGHNVAGNGEGQVHFKYMVVDAHIILHGSFNIDPRSHWLNSEDVLWMDSPVMGQKFATEFNSFIQPGGAKLITWEEAMSFMDPDGFLENLYLAINLLLQGLL